MSKIKIELVMNTQPTQTSCGPTSLHSVYSYWGDSISLEQVVQEVQQFEDGGGTLAVILGIHALKRGYKASLYSYNLNLFDPTWNILSTESLIMKLEDQLEHKLGDKKFSVATKAYISFLRNGGTIQFDELSPELVRQSLEREVPLLAGLSATYLYQSAREHPITNEYDDVKGVPTGHFVVLYGHDRIRDLIYVADPYISNPVGDEHYYKIKTARLMAAIFLGVVTYDGNLLIIEPKVRGKV